VNSKTKMILLGVGAAAAAVIAYEILFVPTPTTDDSGGVTFAPTVLQSWATSAKVGGAVAVGGGAAWLLLLLFP
jgi:hypothetical protein